MPKELNIERLKCVLEHELKNCIKELNECDLSECTEVLYSGQKMINFIASLDILSNEIISSYTTEFMIIAINVGTRLIDQL